MVVPGFFVVLLKSTLFNSLIWSLVKSVTFIPAAWTALAAAEFKVVVATDLADALVLETALWFPATDVVSALGVAFACGWLVVAVGVWLACAVALAWPLVKSTNVAELVGVVSAEALVTPPKKIPKLVANKVATTQFLPAL